MSESVTIQKVKIDPIGCYKQALELVKEKYWLLLGISVVGMIIGGLVPVILIGPMMCGVYMCFLKLHRGSDFEFDLLFKGFDFFVPSLIASLIMTGVSLILLIPGFFIMFAGMFASIAATQGEGGQAAVPAIFSMGTMLVLTLFFIAVAMALGMFFTFAFPLIVDRKLTGTAAVAVSFKAVARNFGGMLGLTLVNTMLGLVGILACYVGTFFILPISFAALTIAYRKVFPEIVTDPSSALEATATPGSPGAAELPV